MILNPETIPFYPFKSPEVLSLRQGEFIVGRWNGMADPRVRMVYYLNRDWDYVSDYASAAKFDDQDDADAFLGGFLLLQSAMALK